MITIEGAVNHHLLFGLGMIGNIFDNIEIAFKMSVNPVDFNLSFCHILIIHDKMEKRSVYASK